MAGAHRVTSGTSAEFRNANGGSALEIGRVLSHYEIIDQLGAGGMGEVYLARDVTLGRKVALKVLPVELAQDPARLARLQREAKVLAALDHPGVVTVFSVEEAEGIHFLTMAYVEGRTLDELIPPQGLAVGEWFSLALALADALRAAHERGIIHRDLKPTNVMVDGEGRLRLLDFGLARVEEAVPMSSRLPTATMDDAVTRQGVVLGTIPYMSPEQAEGKRLDARSDIFSLGVVLYEMATRSRPFRGETPASLTSSILRDEPPSVQSLRPELPGALAAVIRRCLEKDPEARYQTAREVRDELEALRAGELSGTALKLAGPGRPAWRRWAALGGAAAVVVAAGMVVVGVWRGDEAATEAGSKGAIEAVAPAVRSIAVLPLRNMSGDPEQEYFVDGMTEALITGLSKIEALRVIARSSVMPFKGGDTPLAEIASVLGVDAVVEGSVLREGEQVGITAELIDVASERVLWGEHYRRDLTSILALQAEMATAIADEILVALSPEDEARLTGTETVDPAAYDAVLKGLFNLQQFTPQSFDAALQHFETAIEIDPNYAPAYVGVSRVWGYRAQMGLLRPRETAATRREMITRALELDPTLPDAHLDLATFRTWYEWDWQGGEEAFLRAIELNPSSAEARIFYAHLLTILGRGAEGTAQAVRALELDPLNPFFQALAGVQFLMVGRNEEGVAQLRRTLEENPSLGFGHDNLWDVYHRRGMADEALVEAKAYFTLAGDPEAVEALERGWGESGYRGAMIGVADLFEVRAEAGWVQPIALVLLEDYAGRPERVFPWLEKAFEEREPNLPYVGTRLWSLLEVRTDPRFNDLLRRLDVPDQMRGPPAGSEE